MYHLVSSFLGRGLYLSLIHSAQYEEEALLHMSHANQQVDLRLISEIRSGNDEAKEALIMKYTQMVRHIVRKHNTNVLDFDDLVQEGLIGLLGAITEYRPDQFDVKFSSFAYLCIQRKVSNAVKQCIGNKHKALNQAVSLQAYVNGEETRTRLDCIPSEDSWSDPVLLIENRVLDDRIRALLREHLSMLEYVVTILLAEGYTAREIEREFGLSPKRVDNARTRVKAKLRRLIHSFGSLDHPSIPKARRKWQDLALRLQLGS